MRVLICGDRKWTNRAKVLKTLSQIHTEKLVTLVIVGGASGADTIGEQVAKDLGIATARFDANWDFYDKAAGPIRNQWMLNFGKPDLVLAFHSDLENSKGPKDMVNRARKAKVEVRVIE